MVIARCDDCSVLVAGLVYSLARSLAFTCVRQRACVRSPSTSWRALLGGDVCVVRIFAREPTRLAHVLLRNRRLQKTCGYRFCSRTKMFKLMAPDMAAVLI